MVDMLRCFLANLGSEIRVLKDLLRHRSCERCLTGSLHRISSTRSIGREGSDVGLEETNSDFRVMMKAKKSDFRILMKAKKSDFRILIKVTDVCFIIE
jgi:hypothetical protein